MPEYLYADLAISIHTPREGSDPRFVHSVPDPVLISIHTPREGSDFHTKYLQIQK